MWPLKDKIHHLGFSFHFSAALLDRILTEHLEGEFVQIALNYIDWESEFVQAKSCYEVIRKHGKQVVIMEPVKGGLANAPASVGSCGRWIPTPPLRPGPFALQGALMAAQT